MNCATCSAAMGRNLVGRPRKYCSDTCRPSQPRLRRRARPREVACSLCSVLFVASRAGPLPSFCRDCYVARNNARVRNARAGLNSEYHRRKKYGLSPDDFRRLVESQGGLCAVCSVTLVDGSGLAASACVDHCHATGRVRGILCNRCNTGLGLFEDSAASLEAAIRYLKDKTL